MRTYPVHTTGAPPAESVPAEKGTQAAARAALEGRTRGLRAVLPFIGPAFIASVAYIDPGNFATNIQGGSAYGYKLLWVVALANLMAMLLQTMSAKLGLATGKNLAELSREQFHPAVSITMWIVSEIAAMATDLAEFLGASIGLQLIFHLPLLLAALVTGAATYGILLLQGRGFRPLEAVITGLVGVIALCYLIESVLSRPAWGQVALHTAVPWLGGGQSVLFAVGIIGATVMPHVLFLHSSLTQMRIVPRSEREARRIFRFTVPDVVLAMGLAGLINLAMLYMAAATFNAHGESNIADLTTAFRTLTPLLGGGASLIFAISLLASGLSSSTVGTMAGQIIMQGFVGFKIPIWARRLITMLPALIVAAIGVDSTRTLVLSQVVLSFVLPLPVIALIYFTRRRDLMGSLVNHRLTTVLAVVCGALILVLNAVLLYQTFGGMLPGA